jgi:glucoamylase
MATLLHESQVGWARPRVHGSGPHHKMAIEFDEARNGNVALTGELNLSGTREFTVALAFGETLPNVLPTLFQTLGIPYKERRQVFIRQWQTATNGRKPLEEVSSDKVHLFDASYNLLLSHEDKLHQGAFVASLSIPWGRARNDENGRGGYHLVWTRDMVESAMGLLGQIGTRGKAETIRPKLIR